MKWFYYKLNYYKLFYVKDLLHLQHSTGPGSTFYSKFKFDPFNILSQAFSACPPLLASGPQPLPLSRRQPAVRATPPLPLAARVGPQAAERSAQRSASAPAAPTLAPPRRSLGRRRRRPPPQSLWNRPRAASPTRPRRFPRRRCMTPAGRPAMMSR